MNDTLQTAPVATPPPTRPAAQAFDPRKILESLPEDATPAQQDSAIQAHLPQRVKVRSQRPDTLNLPGWHVPSAEPTLPDARQAFGHSYFDNSPFFHAELTYRPDGIAATLRPATLSQNDWVTGILLCSLFMVLTIFARSRKLITARLRGFFRSRMGKDTLFSEETGQEMRNAVFLYLQNGLLQGLLFFAYTQQTHDLFMTSLPFPALLGVYAAICWTFLGVKQLLYHFVNWIFFDKERRAEWMKAYSFLISTEGLLLFPLALITVFFNIPVDGLLWCAIIMFSLIRFLLLYKTFCIFFPKIYGILHLIVYFCTLELLPICSLWQALEYTNDILL